MIRVHQIGCYDTFSRSEAKKMLLDGEAFFYINSKLTNFQIKFIYVFFHPTQSIFFYPWLYEKQALCVH